MSPIYEQPTWQLIDQATSDFPEEFSLQDIIGWFAERYPKTNEATVRLHVQALTANKKGKNKPPGGAYLLYRVQLGVYTRYRPGIHGTVDAAGVDDAADDDDDSDVEELSEAQSEFALELHLEEFMEANWPQINFGAPLEIWEDDEGLGGRQYPTGIGVIDFLCLDTSTGDFVVVELKRAKTSDRVVGQCQRYMGWVKHELAKPGQGVRGLIIAHEADNKIKYALSVASNIHLMTYEVSFALKAAGLIPTKGERRD